MRSLLIVVLAIVLFSWRGGWLADEVDDGALRAAGADPCAQTEHCLAVYLAPWCPQCRKSHEIVQELRLRAANSRDVGFKVIVGRDEPEALERYARSLGGTVFFDDDGSFYRQIGASGVPAWVSWDSRGRIRERMFGRPLGAPPHVLAEHLSERLGLAGLL